MQKYIDEKCRYCSSFFCFVTLHAGTGGIHKFLAFLIMLVFQRRISNQLFAVIARNSLKSLAVSSDSQPEVEPFTTQTKADSVARAFGKQFESSFAGAENKQAVGNFNFRTEDLSTDLYVYIQRRFRARDHYCNSQGNSVEE